MTERNQEAQRLAEKVVSGGIVQKATERLVYQIVEVCAEHERESTDVLRAELTAAREVLTEYDKVVDALRARVAQLEAALEQVHAHICAFGSDEDLAVIDAARKDAPQ